MAKTYADLMAEAEALKAKAFALLAKERAGVIQRILVAVDHYELTAEDLGLAKGRGKRGTGAAPKAPAPKPTRKSTARYSDAEGNTWTGMGPKPRWFKAAIEAGRTPESMMAATAAKSPAGKATSPLPAKFKDESGNTWTGRGSRPRWLRDALATGRSIGDFALDKAPAA